MNHASFFVHGVKGIIREFHVHPRGDNAVQAKHWVQYMT